MKHRLLAPLDYLALAGAACLALFCTRTTAQAADVVIVQAEPGRKQTKLTGEISEWLGKELVLRRSSGREERIPSERVIRIESTWSEPQQRAEQLEEQGKCTEALVLYRQAGEIEQRAWVRRRILTRSIQCYVQTGEYDRAGELFAVLVESDPETPEFHVIPLNWGIVQPTASVESRAVRWLSARGAAVQLMGASWLLGTPRRRDCLSILNRLSKDSDPRVAFLATAQLWRVDVPTVQPVAVARWRELVERMPEPLRAGPYFIIADALARQQQREEAALYWLRIAVLYPQQRSLAAESLWRAAGQLDQSGKSADAKNLYREIVTQHPEAPSAASAKEKLANPSGG